MSPFAIVPQRETTRVALQEKGPCNLGPGHSFRVCSCHVTFRYCHCSVKDRLYCSNCLLDDIHYRRPTCWNLVELQFKQIHRLLLALDNELRQRYTRSMALYNITTLIWDRAYKTVRAIIHFALLHSRAPAYMIHDEMWAELVIQADSYFAPTSVLLNTEDLEYVYMLSQCFKCDSLR